MWPSFRFIYEPIGAFFTAPHILALRTAYRTGGLADAICNHENIKFYYDHNIRDEILATADALSTVQLTLVAVAITDPTRYPALSLTEVVELATFKLPISPQQTEANMRAFLNRYVVFLSGAMRTGFCFNAFVARWVRDVQRSVPEAHGDDCRKALLWLSTHSASTTWWPSPVRRKADKSFAKLRRAKHNLEKLLEPRGKNSLLRLTTESPETSKFVRAWKDTVKSIAEADRELRTIHTDMQTLVLGDFNVGSLSFAEKLELTAFQRRSSRRRWSHKRQRDVRIRRRQRRPKMQWDRFDADHHVAHVIYHSILPPLSNFITVAGPVLIARNSKHFDGWNTVLYASVVFICRVIPPAFAWYGKAPIFLLYFVLILNIATQLFLTIFTLVKLASHRQH